MLVLTKFENMICSVLDTADGVIENISYDELKSAVDSGLEVLGISKEWGIPKTVYLRFCDGERDYLYNGYCAYSNLNGDCAYTQFILFKESYESLKVVIPYLRDINKLDKPVPSTDKSFYDYIYISDDGINFNLMDGLDLVSYTFLDIIALISEGYCIKGLDITNDFNIIIGNTTKYAEAQLINLCKSTSNYNGAIKSFSNKLSELRCNLKELRNLVSSNSYYITNIGLPLFNISDWCIEKEFSAPPDIVHKSIIDIKGTTVTFEDGSTGALENCASLVPSDLEKVFFGVVSKKKLLQVSTSDLENGKQQYIKVDNYWKLTSDIVSDMESAVSTKYDYLLDTSYGRIKVEWKRLAHKKYQNGFFGSRITHTGCYWYSAKSNCVMCGKQKDIEPYVRSGDDMMHTVNALWGVDKVDDYSYYEQTIFPISLHSVKITNLGIELLMNCIVKDANSVGLSSWGGYAASFITVPLLFMGMTIEYWNGIYKINGLLMDIYLEESVFNNLAGDFDEQNLFSDFNKSLSIYRKLAGWNKSSFYETMKKIED